MGLRKVDNYDDVDFELMIKNIKDKHPDGMIPLNNTWNKRCLNILIDVGFLKFNGLFYIWKEHEI